MPHFSLAALVFFRKLLETLLTFRRGRRPASPFIKARAILADIPAYPSVIHLVRARGAWDGGGQSWGGDENCSLKIDLND